MFFSPPQEMGLQFFFSQQASNWYQCIKFSLGEDPGTPNILLFYPTVFSGMFCLYIPEVDKFNHRWLE